MEHKDQVKEFFNSIYQRSDKIVQVVLLTYFVMGIGLAFFYDTWIVGVGVGLLILALYFITKRTFKNSGLNQYIASAGLALFMAQFIFQMHGLFEMHFTAFIGAIALITYQNWKVYIPLGLIVVVHHASFAYVQYVGVSQDVESYRQIYFTQLEYMDLQTFIIHALLFAGGLVLAAIYSWKLAKETRKNALNIASLQEIEVRSTQNIAFANKIANSDFDYEYKMDENDVMGKALLGMRDSLKEGYARERQEKFFNVGIAEVGEIIRKNGENLDELSYEVISYLVKYLGANQGGLFVAEDEGDLTYLDLKGCYAYERKKFVEKRFLAKQGLVGQCYQEQETSYLKEIPGDYVQITSGLGKSTPRELLLIPVKTHEGPEGVIELASFKPFEQYQIEFLEKLGENLASAIQSAKNNAATKVLYENSKTQAEELKAQEEEMRQNQEELQATQEEMKRQKEELEKEVARLREELETLKSIRNGNYQSFN